MEFSTDVIQALNYLHCFKPYPIIHRNVTSYNVFIYFISGSWTAKLSISSCTAFSNECTDTIYDGDPAYSAPEAGQLTDHSPAMDVYSYGVLVIEMFKNCIPRRKKRSTDISAITDNTFKANIERCLMKDRRQRPLINELIELRSNPSIFY